MLIVTSLRLIDALTEVNRTSQSLCGSVEGPVLNSWRGEIPLLFYHIEKITVINDSLEDGSQSKAVMSTKSGREADDRNEMRQLWGFSICVWIAYVRVKT